MFLKGGIFHSSGAIGNLASQPLPAIGGYVGKDGVSPSFVTRWMEKTLKKKCVFHCGDQQILRWGENKLEVVKEIAERLKVFIETVIGRVDAKFNHLHRFAGFDIPEVLAAFGGRGRPLAAPAHGRVFGLEVQELLLQSIRSFA